MEIDRVNIHKVTLPFFGDFSHSLKKGASANNIVVEIVADQGEKKGYGEGAPRLYVTGESQENATHSIRDFLLRDAFPWRLNDVSQVLDLVDSLPDGREHNAAICALEMSLLDLLGKKQHKSVLEYFPQDFFCDTIYYGAALPLATKQRIVEIGQSIKKMGINRLKLKMGKDFAQNQQAIEALSSVFGYDYDLKVDINGVWDCDLAFQHIPLIKEYKVKVIEEPMKPGDPGFGEFAEIMRDYGVILMADESACSLRDVEDIIRDGHYQMINVRLSKCGGFRRSFRIIDYLRNNGISFQIACQLGESGLLSAAGRALSLLCRDAVYHDGSYDEVLLKENVTLENVSFGPGGEAGPLGGSGLGVEVSSKNLGRLSTASDSVTRFDC